MTNEKTLTSVLFCLRKECDNCITNDESKSQRCELCGHRIIKDGKLHVDPETLPEMIDDHIPPPPLN